MEDNGFRLITFHSVALNAFCVHGDVGIFLYLHHAVDVLYVHNNGINRLVDVQVACACGNLADFVFVLIAFHIACGVFHLIFLGCHVGGRKLDLREFEHAAVLGGHRVLHGFHHNGVDGVGHVGQSEVKGSV